MEKLFLILLAVIFAFSLMCYLKLESLEKQLYHLAGQLKKKEEESESPGVQPTGVEQPPIEPVVPEYQPIEDEPEAPESEPAQPVEMVPAPEKKTSGSRSRRFEKLVGENLMSKLGALALVIGIGFFVKFAIDKNWINEVARTALGLCVGFGLWGVAYRLRDAYRNFSSVLAGAGFAVCFVSIAVAYNFYELFGAPAALASLVSLVAMLTWIALRYDRRELAVTAVLGGYIAPFLSAGPNGSLLILFVYTALLSGAVCFISFRRNWWILPALGMLSTWAIVVIATQFNRVATEQSVVVAAFATLYYSLFSLPIATVLRRFEQNNELFIFLLIEVVLNQIVYFIVGVDAMSSEPALKHVRGIVPLYIGFLNAWLCRKYYRDRSDFVANVLLWIAVIGFGLFIPVQFTDGRLMGALLAVYALLLVAASVRYRIEGYLVAAMIATSFDWMVFIISLIFSSNKDSYFITYLISGACYIAIAWYMWRYYGYFLKTIGRCVAACQGVVLNAGCAILALGIACAGDLLLPAVSSFVWYYAAGMIVMCAVAFTWRPGLYTSGFMPLLGVLWFTIFILSAESRDVASQIVAWTGFAALGWAIVAFTHKKLSKLHPRRQNKALLYYAIISTVYIIDLLEAAVYTSALSAYYSAAFSVALIISGAAAMALGLHYRRVVLRMTSLGIFGVLLVKLIAYDLWRLPIAGRICVFILLGIVLLSLSFLYQKLKNTVFANDDTPARPS